MDHDRRTTGLPRRWSAERGQASVEHAALVVVVLVVLAGAVAMASGLRGEGVVNAVNSGIRRAICVATRDSCAPFHVQAPCVVATDEQGTSKGVSLGIVRIGKDHAVAVERRSDGTVRVTEYDDVDGAAGLSLGARFGRGRSTRGDDGAKGGGVSVTADVGGGLRGGWGRSWELADAPAARELVRRVRAGEAVRSPDVDRVRFGVSSGATAVFDGPLGLEGGGSLLQGLSGEGTRDRRTGETTVSMAMPRAAAADLSGPLGLRLGGSVELEPSMTLVSDPRRRRAEVLLNGTLVTRDGSRRRAVQVRVDATRPSFGAGVGGTIRSLLRGDLGQARAAAVALGRWAADEGWIDEREYRATSSTEGTDLELAVGLKVGWRDQETGRTERLVGARSSPPGGLWEDRTDCLAAR